LRDGGELTLTVEHRAAAAIPALTLELSLEVVERRIPQTLPPSSIDQRITTALADAGHPLQVSELRALCRVRTATLYERLAALAADGRIVKSDQGYRLTGR
jgi:hypothetical protein